MPKELPDLNIFSFFCPKYNPAKNGRIRRKILKEVSSSKVGHYPATPLRRPRNHPGSIVAILGDKTPCYFERKREREKEKRGEKKEMESTIDHSVA